jgi:glutaminyl-tRNA synthetase
MISHSICTLEFEDHRPFYDWTLERLAPVLRAPQWHAALELVDAVRAAGTEARKEFALHCHNLPHKLFASPAEDRMRAMFARWQHDRAAVLQDLEPFFELLRDHAVQFAPLLTHALEERRPDPFDLPRQVEFSRLNLNYVVLSKRKLIQLVDERLVDGWDDPRMPTIVGMRRRGFTPQSLQLFAERVGLSKSDSWIDYAVLEQALREDLDARAPRAIAVLDPVRLVIDNLPPDLREDCVAPVHPHRPEMGTRTIRFGRELWIERDDFTEDPPKDYFRLYPGSLVRLRYAYVVRCTGCTRDAAGNLVTVHTDYLPDTRSGTAGAAAIKVKGAIHGLPVDGATPAEVRLYDRLFSVAQPDAGGSDFRNALNPQSRRVIDALIEPAVVAASGTYGAALPDQRFQFERHGYFVADRDEHSVHHPVFNRIVTLKDSWGR